MNLRVQTRYPLFREVIRINFLKSLSKRLKCNITAYENYHRVYVPEGQSPKSDPKEPLRVYVLFQHIQKMVSSETAVIAETRDSWFNCQKLKLPRGCRYEFQLQYGSIGCFYVTLLDISTIILYEQGKAYLEEYVNPCAYLSRKSLWGIALPLGLAKSVSQVDNMASLSSDIFCDILKHFDGDPALTSATHACAVFCSISR
ncbi:Pyruvate decarboxylase 2 [Vitis vinifera]|uniref:Pyruvate decarboxylase 2 n=1 Tax=Vitis vinifera TaxID=29760 RepID=A0A438GLN0_VITVI|nr:Pyruvate decarboxylase 2 [Vitis vinifera]